VTPTSGISRDAAGNSGCGAYAERIMKCIGFLSFGHDRRDVIRWPRIAKVQRMSSVEMWKVAG